MGPREGGARAAAAYAAAISISVVAAVSLLQLWKADLHVPFDYGGDALLFAFVIKTVVERGWYWVNPNAGAPGGFELNDYPFTAHDTFHVFLIKVMTWCTSDWALVFNAYFLVGFPLITLSAMAVLRHFRIGYGPATVGSVLYAFLPSRLLMGEGHLFLDSFYQVPLAILVILWLCEEDPPIVPAARGTSDRAKRWPGLDVRRGRSIVALLICALVASTSLYYAFFSICLLVGAGIWASVVRRSSRNAVAGVALAGVIVAGLGANGLPTILYQVRHGSNVEVGERKTWEAEAYGMKIAQLLLPVDGHRLPSLQRLKAHYNATAPIGGDGTVTSLGLVGDVGFLVLLGALFSGRRFGRGSGEVLRPLAVLNLFSVLLGTVGGFGSLIALLVSPQIRTYSRLSVFIAFFAIFAVAALLEGLCRWHPRLGYPVLPLVLVLGLLDQVTPYAVRSYGATKTRYASDGALVRRLEASVPPGAAIFELPYMSFPEPPWNNLMADYDPIRPYLHSRALRWSYPAMHGRGGDRWAHDVSEREPSKMLETLADAGFNGILIDRDGYLDHAAAVEAALGAVLRAAPVVSRNGRLSFFDMTSFVRLVATARTPEEVARMRAIFEHPLDLRWTHGFFDLERGPNRSWRWCEATGELDVDNETEWGRTMTIRTTIVAARSPARLILAGDLLSETVDLVDAVPFVREIDVPPGHHTIRFACDGEPAVAPEDPRTMVWRAEDFVIDER